MDDPSRGELHRALTLHPHHSTNLRKPLFLFDREPFSANLLHSPEAAKLGEFTRV